MTSYSTDWFRKRAFSSLKKIKEGVWDYSDSLLLYVPGVDQVYESIQQGEDVYAKMITEPEQVYLKDTADRLVAELPHEFEYIDLGPGTAHKEQFVFDAAKRQGKTFVYRPVDISEHYLELATEYATAQGIRVQSIRASFEEVAELLGEGQVPRFVSLGLTFSNYEPQDILTLLRRIAGKDGAIFVNAHMRDRIDMPVLIEMYKKDVQGLADSKMKLLGLDPGQDISDRSFDEGVRAWYTLKRVSRELSELGIKEQDKILLFQSLRYTKQSFENELKFTACAYELLDIGRPFISAVIKT